MFMFSLLFSFSALTQITVTYTSSGSFTVPAGVSKITVKAWGGGAGGSTSGTGATKGGGGGAYSRSTFTVTPGSVHPIVIGTGGGPEVNGGASIFSSGSFAVSAIGGNADGTGGQASSSTGTTRFSGGNGGVTTLSGDGTYYRGGGGGSSAGNAANGTNASGITGGIAPANGGNGANGVDASNASGLNGTSPGGAGSGRSGPSNTGTPGSGANGQIKITYPSFVASSLGCTCNNDQTPNATDGTFNSVLVIKASDNSELVGGSTFTIISSTGLKNVYGGPIGNATFTYCPGSNCPTDITQGQYYLNVQVDPSGVYSATIDGPDADNTAEITLGSTNCNITYPALPTFPSGLTDVVCLSGTLNLSSVSNAVFSIGNDQFNLELPDGFSQSGVTVSSPEGNISGNVSLVITPPVVEADNDPKFELHLIRQISGCKSSSYKEFNVYNPVNPELESITLNCLDPKKDTIFFLSYMIGENNTGGGEFYIDGNLIEEGRYPLNIDPDSPVPVCKTASYTITDSCGVNHTSTANFLLTFGPDPAFNLASGSPKSPQCTTDDLILTLNRTSNGPNPEFYAFDDQGNSIAVNYPTISLPAPAPGAVIKYTICLVETSNVSTICTGVPDAEECSDTFCIEFILYQDNSQCGSNNPFASTCPVFEVDVCPVSTTPGLAFGCTFLRFETPPILTSKLDCDQVLINCKDEGITGFGRVSLFDIDLPGQTGGKKLKDFPGISVICKVLNFKILGWRPLGALYDLLGCDKTIVQLIFDLLGKLAGGDGGGYIAMADTDGDGAFDYLIDQGSFPGEFNFNVPNRVKGAGYITVRAVGGWVNSPSDVCGNLDVDGVNLLDLLPIGSIPIVGAMIEDILAAASCNINLALSVEKTIRIPVINNAPPEFINCNPAGYVFAQTLDCSIPVNWSVPAALTACSDEELQFRGVTSVVDISQYAGTGTINIVTLDQPGIYQTLGPVPGSILEPGDYTIEYTAVGCNGYPSTCSFPIRVTPGNPILECPNDVVVSAGIDECSATVHGLAPYQGIGCASIINYSYVKPISGTLVSTSSTTIGTHNIPDGHSFELGETAITYIMMVDMNGDGDFDDTFEGVGDNPDIEETQQCTFIVTVIDHQLPDAVCIDVNLQLDNEGHGTVYAAEMADQVYIDGGSSDNCGGGLTILLSEDNVNYYPAIDFDCFDKGKNVVNLLVRDANNNTSYCKAVVNVIDYFEGYKLDLDVPEVCFEPFQNTYDFSPYIVIAKPNGQNIQHQNVGTLGPEIVGAFGISAFLPDPGSTDDPGTLTTDGIYTLGTGTGWITISYILSITEQVNQQSEDDFLSGCYRMVHDIFRVEKLDPVWEGGYMCCDQLPVWLGGASWDGTGPPSIPAGMLSLTDIRGSYPGDVYGEWTGDGVSFEDPDGITFSGDEFFQFDPNGFDGTYTLTYTIGDEPCIFDYSQDILVTCQDLHVEISDYTVCPANWVNEKDVLVNLDDKDLVISTTGFAELAADGAHYGGGAGTDPVLDLVDFPVVDGRVVIPGFYAPAIRNKDYEICVTAYQTTPFGCSDVFCYTITVQDLEAPEFQNCPKEPIVVDAPIGWCQSFVNFEYPWVKDDCMGLNVDVIQVDTTGFVSGDMFPVGLSVLAYTATDTVGNQSYCELKIIVDDFDRAPQLNCPENVVQLNDLNECGAVVYGIDPVDQTDNCPKNLSIVYEIKNESGEVVGCGLEDASGDFFEVGENVVDYIIYDQPLLLITEIVQDGVVTGVEVTNFGPSDIDLTCATFSLKYSDGSIAESYMVPTPNNKSTLLMNPIYPPDPVVWEIPSPNLVPVGGTFTHVFNTLPAAGQEMIYSFEFLERVIDEVLINDEVVGEVILRKNVCDHNEQSDFIPATPCDPGSFDLLNPGLPTMTPNGTQTALQNYAPSTDECSFTVTIIDLEEPTCIKHDSITVANTMVPQNLNAFECLTSEIIMPQGIVHDVNIHDLVLDIPDAGAITAYLNSPEGTRIRLFNNVCAGEPDVNVTLDNTIIWAPSPKIEDALCDPLGQGLIYSPEETFKAFFGQQGGGAWILEMYSDNGVEGILVNWDLEILYQLPYDQGDVVLENAPGQCDTVFTWIHPILEDNCCEGTMEVIYSFSNEVTGEFSQDTIVMLNESGTINLQGLVETRVFEVGVTEITYYLLDQHGNTNICGFTVTVLDTENPIFLTTCPDRSVFLEPTECYGELLNPPQATDNCEMEGVTFYFEDGSVADIYNLPIGEYYLTAIARDIYGNETACTFFVWVIEYIPTSNVLACNNSISLSLDPNCQAELTTDMLLEGDEYRCYENYCITILDMNGIPHSNLFDYSDAGQSFIVTVSDCLENGNSCMSTLHIMEKLIPEIVCPNDTIINCNNPLDPELLGSVQILNCEPFATIEFEDEFIDNGMCGNPRAVIDRKWIVDDHQGNVVNCTQHITIEKSTLDEVVFPDDVLNISCHIANEDPESLHPDQTGYPTINGIGVNINDGLCIFSYSWTDEFLQYCGNSFAILRTWKVFDMCGPVNEQNPRVYIQAIKVFDTTTPEICSCEDYVVNVDAFNCNGSIDLTLPCITDDCSQIKSVKLYIKGAAVSITGNYTEGTMKVKVHSMRLGTYPAKWIVEDACGNKSSCNFNIVVEDNFPPFAVCEQYKQVGVTFGGVAEVAAASFNSGSFDNCKPVWFKVWRNDGGCMDLNCDNTACTQQWFDDSVFFCCEDVGKEIMVTLRVFEVDPGVGPINPSRMLQGGDLFGHYNDCMTTTLVQDKSVPLLACEDVTITCEDNKDPEHIGYPFVLSTCGVYDLEYIDDLSKLNHCGIGYITRTWRVMVGGEQMGQCTQRINVTETLPFDPLTIVFPYISEAHCLIEEPSGEQPTWTTNPCNVVEANIINIDTFRFVEDACYKILREWAVVDWCTYEANSGAEQNLDEYRYISGDKRAILDPAKFTEADRDGYYRFTEVIMVYDDTPANIVVSDTCLGVATCVTAQNAYRLEADSYEDDEDCGGEYEWTYVIHSECCDDVIQFSANNNAYKGANYQGGVSGRASEDKLDRAKASLLILPSLEQGRYRVTWTLSDGCGNVTTEYQHFNVVDKKAPTPFLVDIATATMTENCMVEINAVFFDKGACDNNCLASYDNCSDVLYFTYTPVLPKIDATWSLDGFGLYYFNPTTGARSNRSAYLAGNAHSWDPVRNTSGKVFFGPSRKLNVDVFVWDIFGLDDACDDGNFDFATVELNLNSEGDNDCDDEFFIVNGFTTNTANGEGILNVEVAAMKDGESKFVLTDESGEFVHHQILGQVDFIPRKTDDYQNGVNTLDLILIQRHLLGIETMEGDQLIAADANANNSITAADIKQIRDLILGVTTKFPSNDSWVFVPKKYSLNVTLPTTLTFGGIKVGDTNRSASSNFDGELLTPRHRNIQRFVIDDTEVSVGKTVEIDFYAKDFTDVRGFQFTLNTPRLKYKGYQLGVLDLTADNIGVIRDGVTTMSWNGSDGVFVQDDAVLFTLLFESEVNSGLSKLMNMTSEITPAESYRNDALESTNMVIEFRGQTPVVFELYQNEPNPFTRNSVIRFTLPYAGEYTLKIFDATGKELRRITDQGQKGLNEELIESADLTPGMMYYQLSFDKFVSNKKMILVN